MNTFNIIAINRHKLYTDGEGVTTLIGLSGCHLDCKYCINKKELIVKPTQYTVDELIEKVMEDYCYFVGTRGGVTFGGGEPLLQQDSIIEFMNKTNSLFATNIETSLNLIFDIEKVLHLVTELIIDIKDINCKVYEGYTGSKNSLLLQNLQYINRRRITTKM